MKLKKDFVYKDHYLTSYQTIKNEIRLSQFDLSVLYIKEQNKPMLSNSIEARELDIEITRTQAYINKLKEKLQELGTLLLDIANTYDDVKLRVFVAIYIRGYPYKKIAQELNLTYDTVKQYKCMFNKDLKALFGKEYKTPQSTKWGVF